MTSSLTLNIKQACIEYVQIKKDALRWKNEVITVLTLAQ